MDQGELVEVLTEIREKFGEAELHLVVADMRRYRDHIHDPVFSTCSRCGNEFEVRSNGQGRKRDTETCLSCQHNEQLPRSGRL